MITSVMISMIISAKFSCSFLKVLTLAAPHNLNAGSVVRATKRLKCIERGDSVVELDNFKSTLQGYKAPLQEVRDSL